MESSKGPFISIILLSYNYAFFLKRALDAIASQSFKDFEIIFVDDHSTDNSTDVMREFRIMHPEMPVILVLLDKNMGIPYATNIGVENANGKYLMFCDVDDWMDGNTLQLLADAAKENDADRVIAAFRDVDDSGKVLQVRNLGEKPNHWLYAMHHANLFRAETYKNNNIKMNSLPNWTDSEKTFKFSFFTKKTAFVFSPCYNYRIHFNSATNKKDYYKKALSDKDHSFERFIAECIPYIPPENDSNHDIAIYALTRAYYSYLFTYMRDAPLKELFHIYYLENSMMQKYLPNYLKCTERALRDNKAIRSYGRRIAMLLSAVERFHLMPAALLCYFLIAKFHYFRV